MLLAWRDSRHGLRSRFAAAQGVGEQAKTPRCGIFAPRYPTKQEVCQAEQAQARAYDYATGAGNEKSHPRNQKRKQSNGLLFRFWNDVFRKRNVMRTSCVMTASPCDVRFARE